MSDYRSIWEQIDKPKQERKMTEKEQAVNDAIFSGAVQAWLCGQAIQWKLESQTCWKDLDPGSTPDFTALTTEWRPSPIKDPEIKWFAVKDCEPQFGQRCLISDGEVVHFDRWEGDDWKKRGKAYYPHWSPLPKPAQVKK